MQPPLLLAFLLATSGGGGPERDVHSVSPHIQAIERSARRVVAECVFPPEGGVTSAGRQSEKALLAIPQGGTLVRLLEADYEEYGGEEAVGPAARWVHDVPGGATDVPTDGSGLVRINPLGICRDLRLAELEVSGRQDLAGKDEKRYRLFTRLRFEVTYAGVEERVEAEESGGPGDSFEEIFRRILLNAPVPDSLRIPPDLECSPVREDFPAAAEGPVWKVLADGSGFFAVSLEELAAADVPQPEERGISLYDAGALQPCFLIRGERWPGGAVVFHSEDASPFSRVNALWIVPSATESLPLLEPLGSAEGEAVREATFADRYEKDLVFKPDGEANENQERDWLWAAVDSLDGEVGSASPAFEFLLPLGDLAEGADRVDLRMRCVTPRDKSNRRARLTDYDFRVDGEEIPSASLARASRGAGAEEHLIEVPLSLGGDRERRLREDGGVSIRIEPKRVPGAEGKEPGNPLLVDYVEAAYRHRLTLRQGELRIPVLEERGPWEIALPEGSETTAERLVAAFLERNHLRTRLAVRDGESGRSIIVAALPAGATAEGGELWVVAEERIRAASFPLIPRGERLLSPDRGADSVFIVHPSLLEGIGPLVEWHRSEGLRVEVVRTDEIYDAFGDGTLSPHAIRRFLEYSFHRWKRPAPSLILLIGDATWDYKRRFNNGILNYVPGYRVGGAYPTDHWYVTFAGDDKLPEMMIGRIPVFDATTCLTVARKIAEGYAPPGPWRVRGLMLSDKEPEFVREIDGLLEGPYVAPCYRYEWLRLSDFPFSDNFYHPESLMIAEQTKHSPECNQAIIRWLDRGVALWDFHGHGAPNVLGHERIFFGGGSIYTDVKKLRNGRRYPLFIANTCDTARFDYAQEKWNVSLGEDLLQHPDGGCIAMFLHTGRGYPGQHRVIDRLFLDSMFRLRLPRVGQVFTAAKILYLLNPKPAEPLDMMVLIGDSLIRHPLPNEPLRVTVANPRLVGGEGGTPALEFEARPESSSFSKAIEGSEYRAYAYATGSDHGLLWEAEDLPLESSRVRHTIAIPRHAAAGEGTVGVYFYPSGGEAGLADAVGCATFTIEADPAVERELRARIQPDGAPDLRIARIIIEPTEPVSGHTIWINATIVNDGTGEAGPVEAGGYAGEEPTAPRIQGWAPRREDTWTVERLYPGEAETVRMRWDPFGNVGRQVVRVAVDPRNRIAESDENNNSATAEVQVRRKADLLMDERLVRLIERDGEPSVFFRFMNIGESTAEQEFRVDAAFFRSEGDATPLVSHSIPFLIEDGKVPVPPGGYFDNLIPVPAGAEWVEILVDPDDIVDEETHANNRSFLELSALHQRTED